MAAPSVSKRLAQQPADILRLIGSHLPRSDQTSLSQVNREVGAPGRADLRKQLLRLQKEQWSLALPELSNNAVANARLLKSLGVETIVMNSSLRAAWVLAFNSLHTPPEPLPALEVAARRNALLALGGENVDTKIRRYASRDLEGLPLSHYAAAVADEETFLRTFAVDGDRYTADLPQAYSKVALLHTLLRRYQMSVQNGEESRMPASSLPILLLLLVIRGSDLERVDLARSYPPSQLFSSPLLLHALFLQGWDPEEGVLQTHYYQNQMKMLDNGDNIHLPFRCLQILLLETVPYHPERLRDSLTLTLAYSRAGSFTLSAGASSGEGEAAEPPRELIIQFGLWVARTFPTLILTDPYLFFELVGAYTERQDPLRAHLLHQIKTFNAGLGRGYSNYTPRYPPLIKVLPPMSSPATPII